MRVFELYDTRHRPQRAVARLEADAASGLCRVVLAPDAGAEALPLIFAAFAQRGADEVPQPWVERWISERVAPSTRQNIESILREAGCDTYDSLALLIATEGRSSLDDFRLREVTERADDGASRGADAGAGASASAGTDAGTSALGASFAQARKARGISQSRLAHETGLQQAAISRFEHGQANPTIETLQVLAAGIGMKLAIGFE